MIDSFFYCVGNEISIYLVVDLPQASTSTSRITSEPSRQGDPDTVLLLPVTSHDRCS
jgi:hypothetical protein